MCHVSHVKCHISTTLKTTDPPLANSPTMHSRLVHQDRIKWSDEILPCKVKQLFHICVPLSLLLTAYAVLKIIDPNLVKGRGKKNNMMLNN